MEKVQPLKGKTLPEMLGAYAEDGAARFHMPGHKGRGLSSFLNADIGGWDITELSFSDNLHAPMGPIRLLEERMEAAYGAAHSFPVVGGGTAGILAMLLSLSPSDVLLLSRDCHKSAIGAAAVSGISTVFLYPEYDAAHDLPGLLTPEALEAALKKTGATAVYVTYPNYYGFCADLAGLSRVCRDHGALLLVDAAHGAHFPFDPALPEGCAGYADLFCHSQHKTMNALTQTASLHLAPCRISPERVRRMLSLIETTSPSYLLMASLDYAVYTGARQDWGGHVERIRILKRRIDGLPGLSALCGVLPSGAADADETKLLIDVTGRGISGFAAQAALEKENIFVEMADARRLILITTPEDDPDWYERLLAALQRLPYGRRTHFVQAYSFYAPVCRMPLRAATLSNTRAVPLVSAAGMVAAETIGVYPPGIAVCVPGEELGAENIALLLRAQKEGATLFGVHGEMIETVDDA